MRRSYFFTILFLFVTLAAACGNKGDQGGAPAEPTSSAQQQAPAEPAAPATPPPAQPPAAPPAPPAKPDADGIVHITANDQMRYSTNRIEVPAGKVKIELKNVGALPKEAMGHNLTVLKPGSDTTAFAAKAMTAKATDYHPPDAPEALANTKLLGPGESDTIEVELAAGTYPFLCTFPGHVGLMNGVIVAQ